MVDLDSIHSNSVCSIRLILLEIWHLFHLSVLTSLGFWDYCSDFVLSNVLLGFLLVQNGFFSLFCSWSFNIHILFIKVHVLWMQLSAAFKQKCNEILIFWIRLIHFHSKLTTKWSLFFGLLSRHKTKWKLSFDVSLRKPGICLRPRRQTPNWGLILHLFLSYDAGEGLPRLFNLRCVSQKLSYGMSSNFLCKDLKRSPKMIMKDLLSSMGMSYTLMNIRGYFHDVCQCVLALVQGYLDKAFFPGTHMLMAELWGGFDKVSLSAVHKKMKDRGGFVSLNCST